MQKVDVFSNKASLVAPILGRASWARASEPTGEQGPLKERVSTRCNWAGDSATNLHCTRHSFLISPQQDVHLHSTASSTDHAERKLETLFSVPFQNRLSYLMVSILVPAVAFQKNPSTLRISLRLLTSREPVIFLRPESASLNDLAWDRSMLALALEGIRTQSHSTQYSY